MAELSTEQDAINDVNATNTTDTNLPNEVASKGKDEGTYESEGDPALNFKESLKPEEELVCQPCKDEGKVLVADGFCVTCGEHLCEMFFKYHTVPRLYRNHILQEKHEMPREISTKNACLKPCQMCTFHDHELLVSFCNDHEMLCCNKCIELTHQLCNDVESIESKCDSMEEDEELQSFLDGINNLKTDFEETRSKALRNKEEVEWYYEQAVHAFAQCIDTNRQADQEKLTQIVGDCDKVILRLSDAIQEMNAARENQKHNELFIKITLLKKHKEIINTNMTVLNSKNNYDRYFFLSIKTARLFGQVLRMSVPADTLELIGTDCHQLILFPKQRLLIISSSTVTLLNYSTKERNQFASLNDAQSFIHCTEKEILIFVPKSEYWQITNVKNNGITNFKQDFNIKIISTKTSYGLILYNGETFTAFCTKEIDEVAVVELDGNGNVKRSVNDNISTLMTNGVRFIEQPEGGVYDEENDVMFITDYRKDSVFKMTKDGECHCIVISERLAGPKGIAVCRDGTLMVCCTLTKCVVKVTKDGEIYSFIGPLTFEPFALAYDKENALLCVGGEGKEIHAFYA
ncbi:hypothetical protein DPMN_194592 [Dreissena polymorpha]|uniref:B box-type domain-containing protein n=1 Tax=Dreissena polymorpha TaxID=45954 RepID=A0A9D3Y6M5_DREPO|nr:hypothetical protein DPMN_194592 [Dreissena polymorpha]